MEEVVSGGANACVAQWGVGHGSVRSGEAGAVLGFALLPTEHDERAVRAARQNYQVFARLLTRIEKVRKKNAKFRD